MNPSRDPLHQEIAKLRELVGTQQDRIIDLMGRINAASASPDSAILSRFQVRASHARILKILSDGKVHTIDGLISRTADAHGFGTEQSLRVMMSRIRTATRFRILSIRGVGYRLNADDAGMLRALINGEKTNA